MFGLRKGVDPRNWPGVPADKRPKPNDPPKDNGGKKE